MWIDRQRFPAWSFYLAAYLYMALVLHLVEWFNASLPWGTLSAVQLYNAIWFPWVLGIIHHLDHVATDSVQRFAPLLGDRAEIVDSLRYRMTTLPARSTRALYLAVLTVIVVAGIANPSAVVVIMPEGPLHPVAQVLATFHAAVSYAMAPVLFVHAVRQLRLVSEAYALVPDVNLFDRRRLYAFSGLSMRTALAFQAMVWVTYFGTALYEVSTGEQTINLVLSIAFLPASIAIVLLPLMGIHRRLQDAKQATLDEHAERVAAVRRKLYAAIEHDDLSQMKGYDEALESLNKLEERIKAVPTWPWATGAFRNFVSAISVPLVILIVQTLLNRVLLR